MTWVKICGITRIEDLKAAADAGADAIGLTLVDHSPRLLTLEEAASLVAQSSLPTFLLTKDLNRADTKAALLATGASGLQPYGATASEAAAGALELGLEVLRPLLEGDEPPPGQIPLYDNKDLNGHIRAETLTETSFHPRGRFVLAGGLNPVTVAEAVRRHRPWGVDVSSGVESRPRIKDHRLLEAFVVAAKSQ